MAISIHCPHCNQKTALSVSENSRGQQNIWSNGRGFNWWIGICNGCGEPCLVRDLGDRIYPHPLPSPTDENIPENVRRDLDEAKLCLSVKCYRACAVLARRCVQQACLSKGCKKENLVGQITELTKEGHITKDIEEWATVVRWIGNDAAHPDGQTVTKADAEDTLNLAEQFMHVLFVTPAVAKARKAQRGK